MGFVTAVNSARKLPPINPVEIAFAGRSNVGKSSLLNALAGQIGTRGTIGIASVANKPGVTRSLNFYRNNLGATLVDLPGYGFAYAKEEDKQGWQEAMRGFLSQRGDPLRVLMVVDARHSLKPSDLDFLLWLDREAKVPVHVVMSKCDLILRDELAKRYTMLGDALRNLSLRHLVSPHHMVSSKTKAGVDLLRAALSAHMPDALVGKGRAAWAKPKPPSASELAEQAEIDEIATPAARRHAAAVLAAQKRKAKLRADAEAARPRTRDDELLSASDMWARRRKRTKPPGRAKWRP